MLTFMPKFVMQYDEIDFSEYSSMPTRITVATSIAPRNLDHQQSAVASWLVLGFKVISLNSPAEIDTVQHHFPAVTFVSAHRTAQELTGRPFVYFDDVLKALAESGADICGIVNSDIMLDPPTGFTDFICKEATGSFVFGSRIDASSSIH